MPGATLAGGCCGRIDECENSINLVAEKAVPGEVPKRSDKCSKALPSATVQSGRYRVSDVADIKRFCLLCHNDNRALNPVHEYWQTVGTLSHWTMVCVEQQKTNAPLQPGL